MMTVIIFLGSLFSCIITYLATQDLFKKEAPDGTPKKKVGKKEFTFLICLAGLVILPVFQNFYQNEIDSNKEAINKKEQAKRDENLRKKYEAALVANTLKIKTNFDSSNDNQTTILSNTLGEYNLALDKANGRIVRLIKDSAKTTIIEPENPTLFIEGISLTRDDYPSYNFSLNPQSLDASSTDFNITYSIVLTDTSFNPTFFIGKHQLLEYTEIIPKNKSLDKEFTIKVNTPYFFLLLWLKGTYKNTDGNKTFKLDDVYYFKISTKSAGIIIGQTRNKIISFIQSQTKNKD